MNHFIITTASGTRWASLATTAAAARRDFFGSKSGMIVTSVERGRLLTHDEEEQLSREKALERIHHHPRRV
jgi:hypothetical protein